MAKRHHRLSRADLEFIRDDIGQQLLPLFPPEERLRGLTLEERLRGLSADEIRAYLQKLETQQEK